MFSTHCNLTSCILCFQVRINLRYVEYQFGDFVWFHLLSADWDSYVSIGKYLFYFEICIESQFITRGLRRVILGRNCFAFSCFSTVGSALILWTNYFWWNGGTLVR